jgi:phage gp29-like protein
MGIWSRLFGSPPPAVVADQRALRPSALASAPAESTQPEPYQRIEQPGSEMWRSYPEETITPESWRSILRDADQGYTWRLMELYDAVASDYHVGSQLRTRKLAVAGAPVEFSPPKGDESALGKAIAEDAALFWDRIPKRTDLVVDLLDDFFRGFSCVRPVWDSINGRWWVVCHEAIETRYFRFENAITPLICPVPGGGSDGVPVPDGYLYSECRDKAGPVVRAGVGRGVTRSWMYKGYALIDTASFIERFGTPHVQVKTDRTLQPGDRLLEQAKDAARALIADQIGVMPAGCTAEILQAIDNAATTKDVFLAYIEFHDKAISKAIVGQVLTADAGPGGIGHGGAAEEQGDVRQDLREADAERMGQVLTDKLIRPWVLYHYGPKAPVPNVCIDVEQPDDRVQTTLAEKQRAETINILRSAGMRIKAKQQYADFYLDVPDGVDDKTELPLPVAPPQATNSGDPSGGVPEPAPKSNGVQKQPVGDA